MSQELKRLEKRLKKISKAMLSFELGYRSPNTVIPWFKNKRIPENALPRVRMYLYGERKPYVYKKRNAR